MTITFTLPLVGNKPTTSKDLVLSILAEKHPLSLIELKHAMQKQYGKLVSFQSVRQAVLELEAAHVLTRGDKKFALSRTWIQELIVFGNKLQRQYLTNNPKNVLAVGPNVTVYTLTHMTEADLIWNQLIRDIFQDSHQTKVQTFTNMHFWFLLVTLAQETALVKYLTEKGVKSYFLCYGDTPMDRWAVKYYTEEMGIFCKQAAKPKDFPQGMNIGSYGDLIIQIQYPKEVQEQLDAFYKKYKTIEAAKLTELVGITSQPGEYQLTIIKDAVLARNFRDSVVRQFER